MKHVEQWHKKQWREREREWGFFSKTVNEERKSTDSFICFWEQKRRFSSSNKLQTATMSKHYKSILKPVHLLTSTSNSISTFLQKSITCWSISWENTPKKTHTHTSPKSAGKRISIIKIKCRRGCWSKKIVTVAVLFSVLLLSQTTGHLVVHM